MFLWHLFSPRWTLALVAALDVERQVVLEFQSNWLASGARLDVQELRAGYAEVPQEPSMTMTNCLPSEGIMGCKGDESLSAASMVWSQSRSIQLRHRMC